MNKRVTDWALTIVTTVLTAGPSLAADEASLKDLTAVIALHGLPCGQVVSVVGHHGQPRMVGGPEALLRLAGEVGECAPEVKLPALREQFR